MIVNRIILSYLLLVIMAPAFGQQDEKKEKVVLDGKVMTAVIKEGDTTILAEIDDIRITAPRSFSNAEEYRKYMMYRRYANKVYPYAREAIKIFRELEETTEGMKKRKKRKHIKGLQKQLKQEFSDPLKKLTRTQGMILVKMIERELDTPMFELLKNLRGRVSAGYWNSLSKLYGYNLKRGYVIGDDPILDIVLQDFDISYNFD